MDEQYDTQSEMADFLLTHYFPYWEHVVQKPTREQLIASLKMMDDRIVVIRGEGIIGLAMYLTLDDATFEKLRDVNMLDLKTMMKLVKQRGEHVHFVLLAADSVHDIIRLGNAVEAKQPVKSMSWWNPDRTRLHVRRRFHTKGNLN